MRTADKIAIMANKIAKMAEKIAKIFKTFQQNPNLLFDNNSKKILLMQFFKFKNFRGKTKFF